MEIRKAWIEAVDKRISRRTFSDREISDSDILTLINLIDEINKESSLNIQFIKNGYEGLNGFKASYGLISGAKSYIALVGNSKNLNYKQKIGYYGEMIVLQAVAMGLSTCWIGGTYDKEECEKHIKFNDKEELVCIIAIGHSPKELSIKEKVVKSISKGKNSDIIIEKDEELPDWVLNGINLSKKSPSALNKKEIGYELKNKKVKAVIKEKNHNYEDVDLGISMLHFEIGAYQKGYKGNWHFENGSYLYY